MTYIYIYECSNTNLHRLCYNQHWCMVLGFPSFFYVFTRTSHIETVKELVEGSNKPLRLSGVRVAMKLKGVSY